MFNIYLINIPSIGSNVRGDTIIIFRTPLETQTEITKEQFTTSSQTFAWNCKYCYNVNFVYRAAHDSKPIALQNNCNYNVCSHLSMMNQHLFGSIIMNH